MGVPYAGNARQGVPKLPPKNPNIEYDEEVEGGTPPC